MELLTWRCRRANRAGLAAAIPTPDQAPHCRLTHVEPCMHTIDYFIPWCKAFYACIALGPPVSCVAY